MLSLYETLVIDIDDEQHESHVTLSLRECTDRQFNYLDFSSNSRIFRTSLAVNDCGKLMRVKTEKRDLSAYAYGTHRSVSLVNFEL